MRSLAPLASVLVVATALPSQTTHLVGPGGLPQIRSALAIAAPGDVIHVQAGTYAHFEANVAVTIRALVPGSVTIEYDPAFAPAGCVGNPFCELLQGPTSFAPPSGQAVHVTGLVFAPNASGFARHRVVVTSGTVTFDECTIQALERTALTIDGAQVHLQDCAVAGEGMQTASGLAAINAHLIAVGSTIQGNPTIGLVFPGDGMQLTNSTVRASGCTIAGGTSTIGGFGGAAVRTDPNSRLWVSDSSVLGGGSACAVDGVPAVGQVARSTVAPVNGPCTMLTPAPLVGVDRLAPVQNGATFSLQVHTEPLHLVAIHASPNLAHIEVPGLFAQPIGLDLNTFFLAGIFVSDANGELTASWNMPAGQYVDETIWLETIVLLPVAAPILVGPPVGGVIR